MLVPVCLCSVESVSDCIYFFFYFSFQGTPCPYLIQAVFPCFDRRHAVHCMPYKQVAPVAPGEVLRLVSVMLVALQGKQKHVQSNMLHKHARMVFV